MDTLHLSARITLFHDLLADAPQPGASAEDPADGDSASSGDKRHDPTFTFDIAFEPAETDTLPAEPLRDGKGRVDTPFSFELTASGLYTAASESKKHRMDTPFQFERRVPSTDGGLMLAAIRESVGGGIEVPPVPGDAGSKTRKDTSFRFAVSVGDGGPDGSSGAVYTSVVEISAP